MDKHLMVDIETLGTKADASILSIGACTFTIEDGILDTFEVNLKPDDRAIDGNTVRWWLKQSKEAQEKLFDPTPVTMTKARGDFQKFVIDSKAQYIWANGAMFDINILRNLYNDHPPWRYGQEMCMRSIRVLGGAIGVDYGEWWRNASGVQHGALDDAIRQAKYVIAVFEQAQNGFEELYHGR